MSTKKPDVYVVKVDERLFGPFKTPTAAIAWATLENPLAGWTLMRVSHP